ncbi:MAG: response regulator [Prevotella sp.]|jgi:ligand-binding sensor domain-containing protein/signal transduction histidine kinase/DNA-binding response OmpR family regulator|nr:response regulator [Prevotella sp.]
MQQKAILIILLLWINSVCGAENFHFRFAHITNDNGLPQNHVTCIMQDHKGLMWLGTKNGLCKYNGYEMQTYLHNRNDSSSLSHSFIRSVYQDKQQRIWIGTDKGAARYIPESDSFVRYNNPLEQVTSFVQNDASMLFCSSDILYCYDEKKDKFQAVTIEATHDIIHGATALAVDKNNTLWVGGSLGLTGYNADFSKSNEVSIIPHQRELNTNDQVNALLIDSDNTIWIGKNGSGIVSYNLQTFRTAFYENTPSVPNGMIRAIAQDRQGRIWFGTEKGLSVLRGDNTFENIQQDYTDRFALNDNAIYSIAQDRDGNVWVGTYFGGINVFYSDFEQFKYYSVGYAADKLKGKALRQIIRENSRFLWIATEDGGLHRWDRETGLFNKITNKHIRSDNIHSLQIDNDNNLWIGTFWGGLTRYRLSTGQYETFDTGNSSLPSNSIFCLYADKNDTLWIGTSSGLRFYDKKSKRICKISSDLLSSYFIYFITEDSRENLWIGLRTRGLVRYNKKQGVVQNWSAQAGPNVLSDNFVTSVLEDSAGQIWVGTNNGGLFRYRANTDDFQSFFSEGIIPEQCIYALLEDNEQGLWITTNNGLYYYNRQTAQVTQYTTEEGLPTNHFNFASAFKDQDGTIYLGTVQGMISFDPKKLRQKINFPNIVFTGLTIGDKKITSRTSGSPIDAEIDNTSRIVLDNKQAQFFGIEYAGISPGHTQNIIYAVQMYGLSSEWQVVNAQRRIVFSHLPAGKYTFRVKASFSKNTWSDANIRSIDIEVKPPFYASIWAYLFYTLLIGLIVAVVLKFYYNRLKEKNVIRVNQLEKEKLEEMNNLKRNFFTNISHEFKTPLTLIMSPVRQVLEETDISEKVRKNMELVLKNSNSLMSLVKELIDFNRIEASQMRLKLQKGNPLSFIQEICNRFQALAVDDDVRFETEIENLEEEVWFGLTTVEKIINNLLSNAFKYTRKGGKVKLSASITENENEELFLRIVVADTGIGIAAEEQEKVFQAYYQAANQNGATKRPGWGIGLTLVQNLAQLHKGSVSLESEPEKGSVFTALLNVSHNAFPVENRLELRADEDYFEKYNYTHIVSGEQLNLIAKNGAENNGDLKKNEILLVEDNTEMLNFLQDIFSEKYSVSIAENGIEALRRLAEKHPDLIISDIMMPEMSGTELCREVKSSILTSHIPVILLTAKTGTENIIKGYELGADVYIEKPFDPLTLMLQVQNLLRTRDNNRRSFKESGVSNIDVIAKNKYDRKLLNDIKQTVEENIANEDFSVSDVIRNVGISRTMLHVKLKSMLDMSIGDYIRNIRIEKAKELLAQGETIADTAYATGFADPNYFSKCFKKATGKTPSEYVKSTRE